MREDELQANILDYIKYLPDVLAYHALPARVGGGNREDRWVTPMAGDKGFLDLVIAAPNGLLFRELKTEKGKVTEGQQKWLRTLRESGHDAGIWRPSDWPEPIITEIRRIR